MSAVPGSLFNKILFWAHLSCGVSAGLIILLMSATGVLLTYERQLMDSATRGNNLAVPSAPRLPADALAAKAREQAEKGARLSLVFDADPAAPVSITTGRGTATLLNPYTGAPVEDASAGRRDFFRVVEGLHRRLGTDNGNRLGNLIDIANLLFVFIIASGIYLWMPAAWRWRTVKGLMFFKTKYINAKVRDFNWHHAFAFWALIPLFLIAVSGVVMSYPWANRMVYAAFGEAVPQRGGGQQAGGAPNAAGQRERGNREGGEAPVAEAPRATLQQLLDAAIAQEGNWRRITLPLQIRGDHVDVQVELKSSERRAPRRTLELSTADASVISAPPVQATAQSPGQRARSWFRFVHTGEQYGIVGQTIAGLASLAACFLVYTGLALAWRRLILPLFRRST